MGEYTIKDNQDGTFKVTNNENEKVYEVDIIKKMCNCKAFKYTKKTRTGFKRDCKHIKVCRGIIKSS